MVEECTLQNWLNSDYRKNDLVKRLLLDCMGVQVFIALNCSNILEVLDTTGRFSNKGDNFCDLLEQILSFLSGPLFRREANII